MIRMTKHSVVFILLLLLGFSCKDPHPGYKLSEQGIYYKLLQIGENNLTPENNDYLTFFIEYKTISDSTFFQGKRKLQYTIKDEPSTIDLCIKILAEGDKAEFMVNAKDFYHNTLKTELPEFLEDSEHIILTIEMIEIQSEEAYKKEKEALLTWIKDFGEYEKILLKQYLTEHGIQKAPTPSGLYHIILKEGKGKKVKKRDTVIFHYEGRFLNGKFFDSSKQRLEPFGLVYGQEWQVIRGLEEAIGLMHEGEKALCIVPSELAWGKTGSTTGIIAPYTSLIFEIEILEVRAAADTEN